MQSAADKVAIVRNVPVEKLAIAAVRGEHEIKEALVDVGRSSCFRTASSRP